MVRVALLGSGSFGEVHKLGSGLAGKCYKHPKGGGGGLPRDAVKEIALLAGLSSEHIVTMRGTFASGSELWCLMDCAPHGDLRRYMKDNAGAGQHAAEIAYQMFAALAYLHSRNVVHRDIKPENFLVFTTAPTVTVKLSDLGSALVHGCTQPALRVPRTDPVSTLWYRAPEILFGLNRMHGPAMDVWSAGLILCELSSSSPPVFQGGEDDSDLVELVCAKFGRPDITNDIMPSFNRAKLEGETLSFIPQQRPGDAPPYDALWHPQWADNLLRGTLILEPSKRMTAGACAKQLNASWRGSRPKAPKVHHKPPSPKREAYALMLRALAGDILFESCVRANFDRRSFHAAARILDRDCEEDPAGMTDPRMPVMCAAAASIASKLCETAGIGPSWGHDLRVHAETSGRECRGLGRFTLSAREVEIEEARMLDERGWDVWDVLILDVAAPPDVNPALYAYVCDMLVAHMGTRECTPHEMSEVAGLIAETLAAPKAQKVFPAKLLEVLETAVDAVNSNISDRSPVKNKYASVCGRIIYSKVGIDTETIKWI